MHEAMNLKLRGSRHNIDILKLKMLSLILTKQRAGAYGAQLHGNIVPISKAS